MAKDYKLCRGYNKTTQGKKLIYKSSNSVYIISSPLIDGSLSEI